MNQNHYYTDGKNAQIAIARLADERMAWQQTNADACTPPPWYNIQQ